MLDEKDAREAAAGSKVLRGGVTLGDAQELREGWYFRLVTEAIGCGGVIVNKQTGKLFQLGSAFPVERDLQLYDRGYQFESYDLEILEVHDRKQTLKALDRLELTVVEPELSHGVVWKVPRPMTTKELAAKLDSLPCTFSKVSLYFEAEKLEQARQGGWFTFRLHEHVPAPK